MTALKHYQHTLIQKLFRAMRAAAAQQLKVEHKAANGIDAGTNGHPNYNGRFAVMLLVLRLAFERLT
jgi:hypothetical protein